MSGLTGYLTIDGVDLSNVFLNINGNVNRRNGTNGPAVASNIWPDPNVPQLCIAYTDYPSVSGVAYAYVFYNPSVSAGSGMSTPTFIPAVGSGSPFASMTYTSGVIQVSTSTSQSYKWLFMSLNGSNTGYRTNNLDLTQIFRNINGFGTVSSGSYVNSVTSITFSIPSANVPYQFVAYSTGAIKSGMITAYVYYSSTVSVGGVTITSNIGNMVYGLTYSSGTITLTTQSTSTNNILYNFNTVV